MDVNAIRRLIDDPQRRLSIALCGALATCFRTAVDNFETIAAAFKLLQVLLTDQTAADPVGLLGHPPSLLSALFETACAALLGRSRHRRGAAPRDRHRPRAAACRDGELEGRSLGAAQANVAASARARHPARCHLVWHSRCSQSARCAQQQSGQS